MLITVGGVGRIGSTRPKRQFPLNTELLQNGGFNSDTGIWTLGVGYSISGGLLVAVAGTNSFASQTPPQIVAGGTYELTYTLVRTAGTLTPRLAGGTNTDYTARAVGGTFTESVVAVTSNIFFRFNKSATFAGTIDNASLKRTA